MEVMEWIERLFAHYGYMVLLFGLPLDAIASPIPPGNTTLTYTGYLSKKGVLEFVPALASACVGSILGITITYGIGHRLGMPLIERYGKWLSINPDHVVKTRRYYDKYGNKLLLFGYFIPGVRQMIGYFVGIIRIPFRTFALYAYPGSLLWVISFFTLGYVFADQWQLVLTLVEQWLKYILITIAIVLIVVFLWRRRRI